MKRFIWSSLGFVALKGAGASGAELELGTGRFAFSSWLRLLKKLLRSNVSREDHSFGPVRTLEGIAFKVIGALAVIRRLGNAPRLCCDRHGLVWDLNPEIVLQRVVFPIGLLDRGGSVEWNLRVSS